MEFLSNLVDLFLHLDQHLNALAGNMGPWLYLILFAVIFCETGLVVTPFLPGDSLLFAVGALAATAGSTLSLPLLAVLLVVAAVAGDAVSYWIGYLLGPKVFQGEDSWLLNKRYLLRAQGFYDRHGGKTIVLARFIPIVRTFAPFVAGVGRMQYRRFWLFNATGGLAWVMLFLLGGYWFGTTPFVQRNFHFVILAIIVISVLPIGIEWLHARRRPPQPQEELLVSAKSD
jgi:membrane-associated protein